MAPASPVMVDDVWATRTHLHVRVTVWSPGWKYRKKHRIAVNLDDIPEEALAALWQRYDRPPPLHDSQQGELF